MDDEAKIKTLIIDVLFVPSSKMMVGPFVNRMVKIKGARIDTKLIQILRIE